MTFTYSLSTDIGKIRLHINDTDSTAVKLTDEEIQYAIDSKGSVGGAVVWCIQFLMAKVADPNFTADWLQVDNAAAYKSLASLLALKRQEFGIPVTGQVVLATSVHTYRVDSQQDEDADYSVTGDDDEIVVVL